MIVVPEDFAAGVVNQAGAAGQSWIDRLPSMVESYCDRWDLAVDGATMHGYLGIVVPVKRREELCALKVSWIDESNADEISALTVWNGRGAVRLLDAEPVDRVILLERLDSRRSLFDVEIGEAVDVAGHLVHLMSIPGPNDLPQLRDVADRLSRTFVERWESLGRPIRRPVVDSARELASQLAPTSGSLMVNYDLHYGNVLAAARAPWLAIDPKVVVGDPEYGLAQLFWTRLADMNQSGGLSHHFHALVDRAGLDLQLARSWTLVRCVDYWLWALSIGLTEDPVKCEFVTYWLTS